MNTKTGFTAQGISSDFLEWAKKCAFTNKQDEKKENNPFSNMESHIMIHFLLLVKSLRQFIFVTLQSLN